MGGKYVWVDEKYEPYIDMIIDCIKIKGDEIPRTINKIAEDTKTMQECLDDDFLEFKLHAKKIRDEYKAAVEDQLDKTQKLWDECDKKIGESRTRISEVEQVFSSVENRINDINCKLSKINTYKIEELLELINKFMRMSDKEKEIMKKLFEIGE